MISVLADISSLILKSHDLHETLNNIATLVAKKTRSDACSIYLFDQDRTTLRLQAAKGLSKRAVGKVSMPISEGLTGLAIEVKDVVSIKEPQNHPRFRYFKETREERFHTFIGVPMIDRNAPQGVMVVQHKTPRDYTDDEISALKTIAFQISSVVVNARLLDSIARRDHELAVPFAALHPTNIGAAPEEQTTKKDIFRGRCAYPGVVSGPVTILEDLVSFDDIPEKRNAQVAKEITRLESALEQTCIQTVYLEKRVAEQLSEKDAAVFHTHLMILEDRSFLDKIVVEIKDRHSAEFALKKVVKGYVKAFEKMDDQYLSERAADMKDIGRRILANLTGKDTEQQMTEPGILVTRELLPSEMARMDHKMIRGIVTEAAGANSHAVIMAKSLGIPAVVGVEKLLESIAPGDKCIVDANTGSIYINPSDQVADEYARLEDERRLEDEELACYKSRPCVSSDDTPISLMANIGLFSDVEVANQNGAQGVGLYRTEFLYMTQPTFPSREEQYQLYRKVVESFNGKPVAIRTLDIGGDKALPYLNPPREDNPFLGWRSIRFSLDNRDIFRTQIEAILMAGIHGPVKILFPMISGMDDLLLCKEVIDEALDTLDKEGVEHVKEMPVGIMIEVPSALHLASRLAKEVSFFALGTNDLIQYLLAIDRNNELVRRHYDPLHPAVITAIKQMVELAQIEKIGLCVCGEMANDPLHLYALLGLGVRELSVASPFIPRIKAFVHHIDVASAVNSVEPVLNMSAAADIRSHLNRAVKKSGAAHWLALF